MTEPIEVLDFWLKEIGPDGWYVGGELIDDACRSRFAHVWEAAHEGRLEHWLNGPSGALAYLIVTDQFARNIHRGKALAFATDAKALSAAHTSVSAGWDMLVPEPERQFFYMPFEHCEDADEQELAVKYLSERLSSNPEMALHARAHQEIIRRYGRFPTRNGALGRMNTTEEQSYLDHGGYGALVELLRSKSPKE